MMPSAKKDPMKIKTILSMIPNFIRMESLVAIHGYRRLLRDSNPPKPIGRKYVVSRIYVQVNVRKDIPFQDSFFGFVKKRLKMTKFAAPMTIYREDVKDV